MTDSSTENNNQPAKYEIAVAEDMLPLVQTYLQRRQSELTDLQQALDNNDFEVLQRIGHQLKGSGPAYGFEEYGRLGKALDMAAQAKNINQCSVIFTELELYLTQIKLVKQ